MLLVGARRSGTNWLQRILQQHPEIVGLPPETYVFNRGIRALTAGFQHTNPGSPLTGTMFIDGDAYRAAVRALVDRAFLDNVQRLGPDARYVLERTPWHVYDLELVAQFYPDARVVHIIRDGRAVARSLMSMDWGPDTMREAAEEWCTSVAKGRGGAALFGDRYREVRYEQLLGDPAAGAAELFAWLELDASRDLLDRIALEARSEFNVDPSNPGISAAKWRGALSAADLRTFGRVAGGLLAELGYEATGAAAAPTLAERAAILRRRAEVVRHARSALHTALESRRTARGMAILQSNHAVVERFQQAAAAGRVGEALALLAPLVRVRLGGGPDRVDVRGRDAGRRLVARLADERWRPVWGEIHSTDRGFTVVGELEGPGGERLVRTLVLIVTAEGAITNATLYETHAGVRGGARGE